MVIKCVFAFLLAFLVSVLFGKFYVPWLEKKNAKQPLKEEVARMYEENDAEKQGPAPRDEAK